MARLIPLTDEGWLIYDEDFLSPPEADALFAHLCDTVPWERSGRPGRPFPRLTAWYSDAGLTYSYSGVTHHAVPWTPELLAIKEQAEAAAGTIWNSLLLNFYRDGQDS